MRGLYPEDLGFREQYSPVLLEDFLDALQLARRLHIEEEDGKAHDQQQPGQEEEHAVAHRAQLAAQCTGKPQTSLKNSKIKKFKVQNSKSKTEAAAPDFWSIISKLFGRLRTDECSDTGTNARPKSSETHTACLQKVAIPIAVSFKTH